MNFAKTFIERPVATTLLVLTILIFGIMGYFRLRRGRPADGRLSDHPGERQPAGRQSRHDGLVGGDAAREAVRDDFGHHFDQLAQQPGQHQHLADLRSRSQHRLRRAGRADGDRPLLARAAARHADAAVLQQEQPERHAHPVPHAQLRHAAAGAGRPLRRDRARAAALDGHRRCAGQRVRRAEVRGARRSRSDRSSPRARSASTRSPRRSTARTSTGRPARSTGRTATSSCSRADS